MSVPTLKQYSVDMWNATHKRRRKSQTRKVLHVTSPPTFTIILCRYLGVHHTNYPVNKYKIEEVRTNNKEVSHIFRFTQKQPRYKNYKQQCNCKTQCSILFLSQHKTQSSVSEDANAKI